MLHRLADLISGGGVPDLRDLVRSGDDLPAVAAEDGRVDRSVMLHRLADLISGGSVPDTGRGVV